MIKSVIRLWRKNVNELEDYTFGTKFQVARLILKVSG